MLRVPDAASVAAAHWLETARPWKSAPLPARKYVGALQLAAQMREATEETGAIVTRYYCDSGDRYPGYHIIPSVTG
ncbi:hypothetical protein KCP75_00890 [Salmonella enterica subsp. enterica]|nr:hypothetical protein KCP75_00890 [Salmonella enterica subsp. enterica]